ncbi:hypothetical protein D3C80_551420 [compost metagenome]
MRPGQQRLTLGGRHQVEISQHPVTTLNELFEQAVQLGRQPVNGRGSKRRLLIAVVQVQGLAQGHGDGQGIVGAFKVTDGTELHTQPLPFGQGSVQRVVLEHQQGIEQRIAALPRPALDIEQRRVLVLAQGQVGLLHLLQPATEGVPGLRPGNHRQGVDEQANLLLDAANLHRPPSHGSPEGHRVLPGVALQQQQPGRLHQRIEGDFLLAGKTAQALGHLAAQVLIMIAMGTTLGDGRGSPQGIGQACGQGQVGQLRTPERFTGLRILMLQPLDVVPVPTRYHRHRLAAVALEDFAQQASVAPAIEQQVMAGLDQVVARCCGAYQGQAQQGRPAEREAIQALLLGQLPKGLFKVVAITPVQYLPRQLDLLVDHLQRALQLTFPDEPAAQNIVGLHRTLPGSVQALWVKAINIDAHLVDVIAATLLVQAVEQHALLHR